MNEPDVHIRAPTPDDAAELITLNRASADSHRPWSAPPVDGAQFAGYLARCAEASFCGFLICRAEDGAIVGVANLSQIVRGNFQSAYLGYYGGAPFAGRGYMRRGVSRVLDEAFGALGLHRVEANIQPANAASIALVRRLGFRLEGFSPRYLQIAGEWRDHERYAMLSEQWKNLNTGTRR
jgi:ribosomal-protein-alanine N-acetyltransferase